jgi:TRAP-type C4-dicarboxylate transport system permease small subunit
MTAWLGGLNKWVTKCLEFAVGMLFLAILGMVVALVILRYVFGSTVMGGDELIEYLFIYTSTLGAALVLGRREHVSIPVFWKRMKPWIGKVFDVVNHLLIILLNVYMIMLSRTWIGGVGSHLSYMLHVPMWVFQVSLPIGCGFTILYCLLNMVGRLPADRSLAGGAP